MPSVRTTPKVVTRARMSRSPSLLVAAATELTRSSLACKRVAGEDATDEPHVALRHPEGVADVAGAVAVHVARLGVGGAGYIAAAAHRTGLRRAHLRYLRRLPRPRRRRGLGRAW